MSPEDYKKFKEYAQSAEPWKAYHWPRQKLSEVLQHADALRARIAELEGDRDAALNRAREARETAENYLGHCDAACKQLEAVEAERDNAVRYTELLIQERDASNKLADECSNEAQCAQADLEAARAGESRAVELLEKIRKELTDITQGKQDEVKNDFTSGEAHGWWMALQHFESFELANSAPLTWLAQRERLAAAEELRKLEAECDVVFDGDLPHVTVETIREHIADLSRLEGK